MRRFHKIFIFIFFVYLTLGVLINLLSQFDFGDSGCSDRLQEITRERALHHQRNWQLNTSELAFCATYRTYQEQQINAFESRNSIIQGLSGSRYPWAELYRRLVIDAKPSLYFLVDSLSTIIQTQKLRREEAAELIVTFVQDIPYSYLLPGDCESFDHKGRPCVGNVTLGIYSPYEFIHSLRGDCDTRSVLIYAVLHELGYEPIILISDEYAHAMIALNIPTSGDYLLNNGEKYYFWETTAKGWPIGMLPPATNNKAYWKIALNNEL